MTNDDFAGLFGDDFGKDAAAEFAKLDEAKMAETVNEALAPAVKAEQPANGLRYAGDTVAEGTADSLSWYRLLIGGKTVLWVSVNNDRPLPMKGAPGGLPEGATVHGIWVWNADKTKHVATNGLAARYEHPDGTGTHVDGATVQLYVIPRAMRYVAEFYGV